MKPLIIINYKNYPETTGKKGEKLARELFTTNAKIVIAPQTTSLELLAKKATIFSQHADPLIADRNTGYTVIENLKRIGVKGTLLNHSEHQMKLNEIKKAVALCKKHKLTSVVCAPTTKIVSTVAKFKPDYVAYEPPSLIGGKKSVTSEKPAVIKKALEALNKTHNKTKLLVGAGVKTSKDLKKALELGAVGVLIASGIVKAKNPKKALTELTKL